MALKGLIFALHSAAESGSWTRETVCAVFSSSEEAVCRGKMARSVAWCLLAVATAALLVCASIPVSSAGGGERKPDGKTKIFGVCVCFAMCANYHKLKLSPPHHLSLSLSLAAEALDLNKELEFAAIQAVLRHLDDNLDGSVDLQESEEVGRCLATFVCERERESCVFGWVPAQYQVLIRSDSAGDLNTD